MMKFIRSGFTLLLLVAVTLFPAASMAVSTSHWTQQSEADFKAGTFDGVVASNLGDLKLSRSVKTLLSQDPRVSAVYAMAEGADGTIYAGTGPQGVLLAVKDEKVSTVAEFGENTNVFSLLFDSKGRLLIGTGGEKGEVYRLDHPGHENAGPGAQKPKSIFSPEDTQYIWSLVEVDGTLYAATGPNGKLFQINSDGTNKVLFDCEENNILNLISDGKDTLYAGTDPNGLVYRINRKSGDAFILYDAGESEVRSLALDKQGNLYAATAEAGEPTKPGTEPTDSADRIGRPEKEAPATPLPSKPPVSPKPPELPLPGPGEPKPIPKKSPATKASADAGASSRTVQYVANLTGHGLPAHAFAAKAARARAGSPCHIEPGSLPTVRTLFLADDPADPTPPDAPAPGNAPAANLSAAIAKMQIPNVPANDQAKPANGNAVYKITPDGFVTEVFRQDVTIFSMIEKDGTLLIGTGTEGNVYQIQPAAEETLIVAKVDPKDVMCLLRARDGRVWMGLADSGQIATLGADYATKGTYTSAALDAKQVSRFGKINLHGTLPAGTTLTVATRAGNVEDTANAGWSKWSDESAATEYVPVTSPSARFLQYRLTFNSPDGKDTPVVDNVSTGYLMPNSAPKVNSIKIASSGTATPIKGTAAETDTAPPTPSPSKTITWEAADPNNDVLRYTLYYRAGATAPWILLKDKVTDATFDWNTRNVADGRYQIKVVASDAAANPVGEGKSASRVSETVVVDNTPPEIGDLKVVDGPGNAKIEAKVVDHTSTVAALAFSIDSAEDWQAVLPVDKIADSPEEAYSFVAGGLSAGPHQITLRATDSQGNASFVTVNVTADAAAAN